jgi:hypothetical protein
MHIISSCDLSVAQEHAIEGFERARVKLANELNEPITGAVKAVFKTFQGQEVMVTLDKMGVITSVNFTP